MGYADGFYYGQGRIICDTSTFSVGDTIRVRSMTDSSKVWNQQVATVGTALVFTVPCYDYYKICTVQDIGGVATEIGGVYKTVDYGQTYFIDVLDKTTLGGHQGIINAHQEGSLLAVGDEVDITVGGNSWTMQVANIDTSNHIVDYVSKNLYSTTTWASGDSWYSSSNACTQADSFYSNISANDKQYIKQKRISCAKTYWGTTPQFENVDKYVWLPKKVEMDGIAISGDSSAYSQFALFVTQANRVKTYNGTAIVWWCCDGWAREQNPRVACGTTAAGVVGQMNVGETNGICPCFRLTADS